jgi:hypothetical protein
VGAWVGGVGTLTTSNTLYDLFDEAGAPYEALQDELIDWIHDNVDIALFVRAIPPDTNVEHIVVNTVQLLNVATATTTPRTALPNVAMSSVSTGSLNLVGTVLPTYATNTTVNFAIYPSATTAGNPGIVAGTLSVDAPGVVVVRAYVTNGTVVPTSADFETWFQVTFTAWVDPAIALAEAHARRSLTHLTGTGVHIRGQLTNVDQWSRLVDNHTMDALGGTNLLGASVLDGAIPRPIAPAPEFIIPNHLLGGGQGGSVTLELTGWGGQPWRNAFALPEATNLNAAAPNYVQTANNVGMLPTPANAGWHQQSQDHWFYSGLQSPGTGQFSEIPFEARFNGTQVTITWPAFVPGAGTILRMPLIAQGTNANFTAHPVLTMTNAAGVQSELAFATAGAGVRASIGGARTGITFVNVQDLVIEEIVRGSLRNNGHIRLTLPWGYRWDPSSEISVGLAPGATVFIPSHDHAGIPRDGNQAQSMMVIDFGVTTEPIGIAARNFPIEGLRIIAPPGMTRPIDGEVNVSIAGNAQTAAQTQNHWRTDLGVALTNLYTGSNPIGAIPTTLTLLFNAVTPSTLHVATFSDHTVVFNTVSGNAGNVSTIAAGWLPAQARMTGRPGLGGAGNFTAGSPAGVANGNVATVSLTELTPTSAWLGHSVTFSVVDAAGEIIPDVSIQSVHFSTTSAESNAAWGRDGDGIANAIGTGAGQTNVQSGVSGNFRNRVGAPGTAYAGLNWEPVNLVTTNANYPRVGQVSGVLFHSGQSVTVSGITLTHAAQVAGDTLSLIASFALTADINFTGPVYIAVDGPALAAGQVVGSINNPQLQVANVRPSIIVDTGMTSVQIGFQELDVHDIRITEYAVGDFRTGTNIQVSLGEYGVGQLAHQVNNMLFTPITASVIPNHMSIGGSNLAQQRAIINMQPFLHASEVIQLNVLRSTLGDTQTYIDLTGLQVRTSRNIPYGSYELVLRGSSVLNNEDFRDLNVGVGGAGTNIAAGTVFWFNVVTGAQQFTTLAPDASGDWVPVVWPGGHTGGANFVMPNTPGFRRYGHGPLMIDYVEVITPGAGGGAAALTTMRIPHAPGTSIVVGGENITLTAGTVNFAAPQVINGINVPANRLFVPVREIINILGGVPQGDDNFVSFFEGNMFEGRPHVVAATIGDRTVTFTIGSNSFHINGVSHPMSLGGDAIAAFIGDGTNGTVSGRTYLPLNFILEGFGINWAGNVDGHVVVNP